ncbi:aminoglycoside phosphotransferase [Mucilaginibacter terrenus]|uniref:Aminoglycoside phosphotransferase n=1 Tax=Mucilaginibacter terrenus TaxID=2482727 RepID=A0A3E2NQN8_9SPHI|nr:phosphotransferase [Mucilaginibacter terrenus]RFZ83305.1 aminoglycoside phosphotransferase [Mucilaginibacter terrenus]
METFPVISSILSATHLTEFFKDKYALSAGTTCKLLKAGINHTYLVTDGNAKQIFRIYDLNWRTELEIAEEIRLLSLLKEGGINVSYPVADAGGALIQQLNAPEGMRHGVMFSFAEGGKMLNFSADLHYHVGSVMAQLHKLTCNVQLQRVTYTPDVVLTEPFNYLKNFLAEDNADMLWLRSAQKYLLQQIAGADDALMRKGAIHLDIWFDNLNITGDGRVTLFDFDFCGNGWQAYDVAYYILQLHSTEKDPAELNEKKKSFLAGYESVTKLTDEERRMLPVLGVSLYFFYLGIQSRRYDNYSNVFFNEVHLSRFINLLVRKFFEDNVYAGSLSTY